MAHGAIRYDPKGFSAAMDVCRLRTTKKSCVVSSIGNTGSGLLSPSTGHGLLSARNHLNPVRMRMQMTVKRIETGTPEGDALGFFEHLFSGWLETGNDNRLYLHYIISRNRNEGNTQALLRQWLLDGYDVRVVMPRPVMQHILKKYQFIPSREYFPGEYEDTVEVWFRAGVRQPGDVQIPPAGTADPGWCCSPITARAATSK